MSTTMTIFLAAFIKGSLTVWLVKKGWWPDWEKRALRREEHKRVIKAYEEWCEQTGRRPMFDQEAWAEIEARRGINSQQSAP
jgi:hypothetical protein